MGRYFPKIVTSMSEACAEYRNLLMRGTQDEAKDFKQTYWLGANSDDIAKKWLERAAGIENEIRLQGVFEEVKR